MCNENEEKMTVCNFCTQKVNFDRQLQKLIGTDHDETSNIEASHSQSIHTVVITWHSIGKYWPSTLKGAP